jgi:hypothetical protein
LKKPGSVPGYPLGRLAAAFFLTGLTVLTGLPVLTTDKIDRVDLMNGDRQSSQRSPKPNAPASVGLGFEFCFLHLSPPGNARKVPLLQKIGLSSE